MYAVIKTGGKQYRVSSGDTISVEKLSGNVGDKIDIEDVLMVGGDKEPKVGSPNVKGAKVSGTIVSQGKGKKITVLKYKRRKGYRRKQGHRQDQTRIKIDEIVV
ncbi:MAG: 50S ribosomal protein L21 [Deltaproteobacteria bacterium]|uniref:Large ribosomal subunit protein bL21 n=1 Tax=Candidatus Zymogenus saltonus TaxID=2844893 RepID=A0A9D8PKN8_9DELT|nr:50S ribosomal protein L21 [Candidatus Zymogenus saltonus]